MGTPNEEALAAARKLLAEQAGTVTGDSTAAGIFGDVAERSRPPEQMDLSKAARTEVDPEELLAAIEAQQAQINQLLADAAAAKKAAEPAPSEPPDVTPRLGNASGEVQQAFHHLHLRLLQVEKHLGLDAAKIFEELI